MTKNKFYPIAVGHITGIFEAKWEDVKEYAENYKGGGVYDGFPTLEEAKDWWKTHSEELPIVYVVKFDSRNNERLVIPKKEEAGLW